MGIPQEGRNKGFWQQGDIHQIVDLVVSTLTYFQEQRNYGMTVALEAGNEQVKLPL